MSETIVDRLYSEFEDIISYLDQANQISFRNTANQNFTKALLLAAASYFEHRITDDLLKFFEIISNHEPILVNFLKKKAISRQYHTYFNWDGKNANQFFSLFGESFKDFMINEVKNEEKLANAIKAFLEIGRERNRLVHQDFGTFTLEKEAKQIYQLYQSALYFVDIIPEKLRQFLAVQNDKD